MNKRRNLKQRRGEKPAGQTKRQRKRQEQMRTLDGRLIRFCQLSGITPEVTQKYVRCTMPSGVVLTVYKAPRVVRYGMALLDVFFSAEYPWRSGWNRTKLFKEDLAKYLFDRLGEKIREMEGGKAPVETPAAQQENVPDEDKAPEARKTRNILTRFVQHLKNKWIFK